MRTWDGNGAARLHAASQDEFTCGLLPERRVPGTPLGQVLPRHQQDVVVARLPRRLPAQPHVACAGSALPPGIFITGNGPLITPTVGEIRRLIAVSWNPPATPLCGPVGRASIKCAAR